MAWASEEDNDYVRYRDTVPRFSAEFGYQGPANFATIARAISERPLDEDSPAMLSHQKAVRGQDKLRLLPHSNPALKPTLRIDQLKKTTIRGLQPFTLEGKVTGWLKEFVLLELGFAMDDKRQVKDVLGGARVRRFAQIVIGK